MNRKNLFDLSTTKCLTPNTMRKLFLSQLLEANKISFFVKNIFKEVSY